MSDYDLQPAARIKAVNAWTFPSDTPATEMARQAAEAGFAGLELVMAEQGELTPETSEHDCARLGQTLWDVGLSPVAIATASFWQYNVASPQPGDRQRAHDLALAMLDRAAWTGADAIVVVPAVVGRFSEPVMNISYADALNRTYDALASLSFEAESRNVRIAVENVWNRFLLSPVELANLVDRLATCWVGVCFDVGNVMLFGYPEDWIATLGSRIIRVQVKDYDLARPGREGFCSLGQGSVNWPRVVAALDHAGYGGPLTYEGKGDLKDISRRMHELLDESASPGS